MRTEELMPLIFMLIGVLFALHEMKWVAAACWFFAIFMGVIIVVSTFRQKPTKHTKKK